MKQIVEFTIHIQKEDYDTDQYLKVEDCAYKSPQEHILEWIENGVIVEAHEYVWFPPDRIREINFRWLKEEEDAPEEK